MESIPEESSPIPVPASERRYIALQKEFLDYKSRVESELQAIARDQAALHSRLVEQSVDLAEAKALIDDLQQQLAFYRSSRPPSTDSGGFWDFLFGSSSSSSPTLATSRPGVAEPADDAMVREYERRFADWQRTAIARIAREEQKLKLKISPQISDPHDDLDEEAGHVAFDEIFDVDWNSHLPVPAGPDDPNDPDDSSHNSSDDSLDRN